MIRHGLQLRLSQQLAMTPQLQQAIRLLQLSTFELKQEIQLALENNPLLEQEDLPDAIDIPEPVTDEDWETHELLEHMEVPAERPLEGTSDELFSAARLPSNKARSLVDELPIYQGETIQTLQNYLMWQVQLTPFTETDLVIATAIVDAIDETGYLTLPLEEILTSLGDDNITLDEVKTALKRIQHFDPVGVAAQDLRDTLRIQLSQLPSHTPYLPAARLLVEHHLQQLAHHDFRALMRLSKLKEAALKGAIQLIRTLNPHPGLALHTSHDTYVIPDILIHKHQGHWVVELNQESLPSLKINSHYAQIDLSSCNDRDNQFIRSHLQEAKWLIKNLESRNETLLKVSRCIVEQQQDFFEHGTEYMKPMVLADIAQKVDLHESTVSRATTQKFMHSPRGLFELKYFFSSRVNTEDGGEASSTAIRALMKKLVATENPCKPLSDSKLAMLLAEQGILVARRTVAKYRESLFIPPSNQRKQLI